MNFGTMRTSLRKRIGSPTTGDVPDASLSEHINNAYQEIFDKYKFKRRRGRAKFTTVNGAGKYNFSSLTDVVYKMWDRTNGRELFKVGSNVLSERDYDTSANVNGKPEQWSFDETYVQLLPTPDGAYVIEFTYKVLFVSLSADNDVPVIPADWHRGIYILAAQLYFEDDARDLVKAEYERTAFRNWIADKPVETHEETEGIDSGVELPTLAGSQPKNLDFDHSP